MPPLEDEIRRFVIDAFLYGADDQAPADALSLTSSGVMDATGVLELSRFLERRYGIVLEPHEVNLSNLDSVARIVSFVREKKALTSGGPASATTSTAGMPPHRS